MRQRRSAGRFPDGPIPTGWPLPWQMFDHHPQTPETIFRFSDPEPNARVAFVPDNSHRTPLEFPKFITNVERFERFRGGGESARREVGRTGQPDSPSHTP